MSDAPYSDSATSPHRSRRRREPEQRRAHVGAADEREIGREQRRVVRRPGAQPPREHEESDCSGCRAHDEHGDAERLDRSLAHDVTERQTGA